jgi:hypothetical protein
MEIMTTAPSMPVVILTLDLPFDSALPSPPAYPMYQTLPESSIRLLVVQPGGIKDPIHCHMGVVVPIISPPYEALSYMWGSSERPKSITLNSTTIPVGRNLWNALKSLRLKDKARTIWVDALCINQEDIDERNHQVQIMSRVYREATKVLIYLGESSEDTDAAFSFSATVRRRLSMPPLPRVLSFGATEKAKALMALCYRPYWRRVWIIQEILAASQLEIMCGTKSMEWETFRKELERITSTTNISSSPPTSAGGISNEILSSSSGYLEGLRRACTSSPAAAIARLYHGSGGTYSIRELLELCLVCGSECRDVRDKIYGLMSLCRDVGEHLIPDYTKTPSQLYIDVLGTWLGHSVVATLDERPDLLNFLENLQRILYDPLWNKELGAFDPMHRLGRTVQLERLQSTLKHIWMQQLDRIVRHGPMITLNEKKLGMNYIADLCISTISSDEYSALIEAIDCLSLRDFHRTEGLDAQYTLNPQENSYYVAQNALDRQKSSYYVALTIEKLNFLLRSRSTGRCSIFMTADGCVGLASYKIRDSDILCHTIGIDNLYIILRARSGGSGFDLIGRALILRSGPRYSDLLKMDAPSVGSKLHRSFLHRDK